jgi:hypothetical protein
MQLEETENNTCGILFALVMSGLFLLLVTPFILPLISVMLAGMRARWYVNKLLSRKV